MSTIHGNSKKNWVHRGAIVMATVATLMFAGPIGANAAEVSPADPISQSADTVASLSESQIRDIDAEIAATNVDSKTFDANAAAENGASAQGIADYAVVLSDQGWTIIGFVGAPSVAANEVSALAKAACAGFNGYNRFHLPWGSQFGVDSCNTSKLLAGAGLGTAGAGAVAAVLAVIGVTGVGLPVAALVAALIGFGAAAIATCQAFSSNGAIWLNLGGVPNVSCWGQ